MRFVSFRLYLGESLSDYSRLYTALETTGLADFVMFTDLRLRLVYPATDGSEALEQPWDLERYYYAIANIDVVAGSALRWVPFTDYDIQIRVHSHRESKT